MKKEHKGLVRNLQSLKQATTHLCSAIREHRWKDALILVPAVISFESRVVPPYYIWKVLHIIMLNCSISLKHQMNLLLVLFTAPLRRTEIASEWMAQVFKVIDMDSVQQLNQYCSKQDIISLSGNTADRIFRCYHALYYYVEWKRKYAVLCASKNNLRKKDEMPPEIKLQAEECNLFGLKTHKLLQTAFSECRTESRYSVKEAEKGKRKYGHITNSEIVAEWILGPLTDIEGKLDIADKHHDDSPSKHPSRTKKKVEKRNLVQNYISSHPKRMPALRFYYHYLLEHKPEETELIKKTLESIVILSPDNILVLDLVNHMLKHDSQKDSDEDNEPRTDRCVLAVKNVNVYFTCLEVLCSFLEYSMRRNELQAWILLTQILQLLHFALVNCFSCYDCENTRESFDEQSRKMVLWPNLFWNVSKTPLLHTSAEIICHSAYAAYILGYSEESVLKMKKLLDKDKFYKEKSMLVSLMKQKGPCLRDFNIYLATQRNERFKENFVTTPSGECSSTEEVQQLPLTRFEVTTQRNIFFSEIVQENKVPCIVNKVSKKRKSPKSQKKGANSSILLTDKEEERSFEEGERSIRKFNDSMGDEGEKKSSKRKLSFSPPLSKRRKR